MLRLILKYGMLAGVIVAVPMIWMMRAAEPPGSAPEHGMVFGFTTMIIALTAVFLGVKHYRDRMLGGVIKFGPALLVGLGISAVASVVYVVGWEISLALTEYDFAEAYARSMVDTARARGASEAELQKAAADAAEFVRIYRNPAYRVSITFIEMFPVGVLISLISAALLRNSRLLPARTPAT